MRAKRKKVVTVFWLIFATIMIMSMIGFLLMPLLYV